MRSTSDPIRSLKRRIAATWLAALAALLPAALWAWRVPEPPAVPDTALRPAPKAEADKDDAPEPLDASVFAVTLWHVPPSAQPPKNATADRPPPPPRLTLVAIIRGAGDKGTLCAALHDPDADALLTLAEGQRAGAYTVTRIVDDGVELTGPRGGSTWLALRTDEAKGVRP